MQKCALISTGKPNSICLPGAIDTANHKETTTISDQNNRALALADDSGQPLSEDDPTKNPAKRHKHDRGNTSRSSSGSRTRTASKVRGNGGNGDDKL